MAVQLCYVHDGQARCSHVKLSDVMFTSQINKKVNNLRRDFDWSNTFMFIRLPFDIV